MIGEVGTVYLLHFDPPYKHAKHYVGWAKQLDNRLAHNANGTGANLCKVVIAEGVKLVLARTWRGTRDTERKIKNRKETPQLCPICNPDTALRLANY